MAEAQCRAHVTRLAAVQVIISHGGSYDPALLDSIAASLGKAGLHERCGDLYHHLGRSQEALQSFRKGHAYRWVASTAALRSACQCWAGLSYDRPDENDSKQCQISSHDQTSVSPWLNLVSHHVHASQLMSLKSQMSYMPFARGPLHAGKLLSLHVSSAQHL